MQLLIISALVLVTTVARPLIHGQAISYWANSMVNKSWELAQFDLDPFNLTDMCVECKKENTDSLFFDCSIKFNWDDPNDQQSCSCEDHWQWDGITQAQGPTNNYSTDYLVCKDDKAELFQFKFVDVFDLSNFSLSLTHMYEDVKNFPTPTITNMFSQPNITLNLMSKSNTSMTYSPACDCPIRANITGMTI
ncbi:hypothetical protein F4776DRAFT_660543 [Hypoxylon sp. NC0597]|nr:hypothetical protein F4776DRAFT_660543 [Hypoxylon sp. NC0597]